MSERKIVRVGAQSLVALKRSVRRDVVTMEGPVDVVDQAVARAKVGHVRLDQ